MICPKICLHFRWKLSEADEKFGQFFLESDVLSLDFASLLCRFSDFGREIASGILAFGIPTILEAAKSCFGRDVAEAWSIIFKYPADNYPNPSSMAR